MTVKVPEEKRLLWWLGTLKADAGGVESTAIRRPTVQRKGPTKEPGRNSPASVTTVARKATRSLNAGLSRNKKSKRMWLESKIMKTTKSSHL